MSFEGKNLYGQYIDYSEKKNGPRASSAPILGLFSIIIRIYSRSQVSVYRTIGPLVAYGINFKVCYLLMSCVSYVINNKHTISY